MIQIDGSDQRLEGVAGHIAVVRVVLSAADDEPFQSHFLGKLSQRVAADELRAGIRQEALALAGEMVVDDVAHDGIEQCVAEKLQAFVVQRLALLVAAADALVHQCLLVVADIMGIEPHDLVERRKKLLLLAEREPYTVNNIPKPHTS